MPQDGLISLPKRKADFQQALDALDVVGEWNWDSRTDVVIADELVALLFNVPKDLARTGTPLSKFLDGIHEDDRERVVQQIQECADAGASFVAEYRVRSADDTVRWILARGVFSCDGAGEPLGGRGIIVDLTDCRLSERAYLKRALHDEEQSLERAADHLIAAHPSLVAEGDSQLKLLIDMLLLRVGQKLSQKNAEHRRRLLN